MGRDPSDQRLIETIDADAIENGYVVQCGTALFANDETFVVFERARDIVVIANFELTMISRLPLMRGLKDRGRLFLAHAWAPPVSWRRRLLGLLPGLSVRSGHYPKSQIESAKAKWRVSVVNDIEDIWNGLPSSAL
jgi:hypothetical protein